MEAKASSAGAAARFAMLLPDETALDVVLRNGRPLRACLASGLPGFDQVGFIALFSNLKGRFGDLRIGISTRERGCMEQAVPDGFQVLEVIGEASSHKTSCLIQIAAHCVTPVSQGGLESPCVFVDLDRKLSLERLARACGTEGRKRMFLVQCKSVPELLTDLDLLIKTRGIRLIVLDGMLSLFLINALTEPLTAGYSVTLPQALLAMVRDQGMAIASSRALLARGECVSKTWLAGVTHRLYVSPPESCRVCVLEKNEQGSHAAASERLVLQGTLHQVTGLDDFV